MKRTCVIAALLVASFAFVHDASAQVRIGIGPIRINVDDGPYYYPSPYYPRWWTDYYYYPAPTEVQRSYYVDPLDRSASVTVLLPTADAQVWFNDALTSQQGRERLYNTPSLTGAGSYTIRARWTEDGKTIDQTRTVEVRPGQTVTVDFRRNLPESLPPPRPD